MRGFTAPRFLHDIKSLSDEDESNIFYTIDKLIKAAKLKNIAAL
jgi:hypothetical protein